MVGGRDVRGQRKAFEQRHDVDRAGFQHRAVAERDLVELQLIDALRNGRVPGKETRAHAVGRVAEPQIEACRLDLVGRELVSGQDPTRFRQHGDHAIRQNARLGHEAIPNGTPP